MKIEGFDKWLWKYVSTTIKNKLGWVESDVLKFWGPEFPILIIKKYFQQNSRVINIFRQVEDMFTVGKEI